MTVQKTKYQSILICSYVAFNVEIFLLINRKSVLQNLIIVINQKLFKSLAIASVENTSINPKVNLNYSTKQRKPQKSAKSKTLKRFG